MQFLSFLFIYLFIYLWRGYLFLLYFSFIYLFLNFGTLLFFCFYSVWVKQSGFSCLSKGTNLGENNLNSNPYPHLVKRLRWVARQRAGWKTKSLKGQMELCIGQHLSSNCYIETGNEWNVFLRAWKVKIMTIPSSKNFAISSSSSSSSSSFSLILLLLLWFFFFSFLFQYSILSEL